MRYYRTFGKLVLNPDMLGNGGSNAIINLNSVRKSENQILSPKLEIGVI